MGQASDLDLSQVPLTLRGREWNPVLPILFNYETKNKHGLHSKGPVRESDEKYEDEE